MRSQIQCAISTPYVANLNLRCVVRYNAALVLAAAGQEEQAAAMLAALMAGGGTTAAELADEPDLVPFHDRPWLQQLVSGSPSL